MVSSLSAILAYATITGAVVTQLNPDATAEAQQRDNSATRAFSNAQIKTSDGRCLSVDKLSGDFRANLTPIQVVSCGSTDGEGWDVITKGVHNDQPNSALIVSTLTQACFNFDPRRAAGNQALLFSCGGRADGGGQVTNSQLFAFSGGSGPLSFEPANAKGTCFTVKGNALDVANCNSGDGNQLFTIGESGAAAGTGNGQQQTSASTARRRKGQSSNTASAAASTGASTGAVTTSAAAVTSSPSDSAATTSGGVQAIANPTSPVPVSRAGGTLNPSAAAEANKRDDTATRAFSGVEIRAPNGQCLSVDPTAGDFRQNLIPVATVDCSGAPNEKWDVITKGAHNDKEGAAIIVSTLMNGCISVDGRRQTGDTVTMFSCGGRADGGGETNSGQLFPYIGQTSFALAPENDNGQTCVLPGDQGRLVSGPCPTDGSQLFSIYP